ncbi:MAG: hypothetical protein ACYTG5_21090, partial [Planctomycetota bacterium]
DRGLRSQETREKARDWVKNHPEAAYAKDARKIKDALSELADERQATLKSKRLSAPERDERLLVIDHRITEIAAYAVEAIEAAIARDLEETLRGGE